MLRGPCRLLKHTSHAFRLRIWPISRCATVAAVERVASVSLQPTLPVPLQTGLKLRDYQEECVQSVLAALRDGRRQVGISLATGSGKTVIFTELVGCIPPPTEEATQSLILVHRQELVEQAARHCSARYPQKTVEIEMGKLHASGRADITVASVQSINSQDRIDKFDPHQFKLILVDEAHHIVSATYLKVLDYFGLQSDTEPAVPALVGVSATFSRADGLSLGKAIKHIVYHKDYVDMIGEKWLSNVIFTTVKSAANLSKVKKTIGGDFALGELSRAVNNDETNLITIRAWMARARDRQSTIVFCVDLAHLDSLTNAFRLHGVDARFVTGDTPRKIRSERLDAFKAREFPVLLNCGVFTEGTDIPNIDCVLLARPTRSRNLLVQMIGRGMRLYPGKENCHIIDMVASLEGGIVTTPTLFGLDPSEIIAEADPEKLKKLKERKERERLREEQKARVPADPTVTGQTVTNAFTLTDYDSVNDLIDDTSGERYIRAISRYVWVCVGPDRYVLVNGTNGSHLMIERQSGAKQFQIRFTAKIQIAGDWSKSPFMRPRVIGSSDTFESAVHAGDTFAKKHFIQPLITRSIRGGGWRGTPATESQIVFLNKFRDIDDQVTAVDITKGKASDMITKIKFGARGHFNKLKAEKRSSETTIRKERAWQDKQKSELVEVGPLPIPVDG